MKEQIKQIDERAEKELCQSKDLKQLNDLKVQYLGKKGELTQVLRGMKDLTPEERPIIGEIVNKLRDKLETIIKDKEKQFEEEILAEKLKNEEIDITLPSSKVKRGSKHPLNRIIEEIEDLFISMDMM